MKLYSPPVLANLTAGSQPEVVCIGKDYSQAYIRLLPGSFLLLRPAFPTGINAGVSETAVRCVLCRVSRLSGCMYVFVINREI